MRVQPGRRNLRREVARRVLLERFRKERDRLGFRLVHYSIQHNHWHLIVEAVSRVALARGMQRLNIRCARGLNRLEGRKGRVFTDRYDARVLATPTEVRNRLAYVLLNHRHHAEQRGDRLDPNPLPDYYSSGRCFDGWSRPFGGLPPPASPDETAPPGTWLLRQGWRLGGTISLAAVPGTSGRRRRGPA